MADPLINDQFFKILPKWRVRFFAFLVDLCAIIVASYVTYFALNDAAPVEPARYVGVAIAGGMVCWFNFGQGKLYDISALLDVGPEMRSIIARWSVIWLAGAALSALTHFNTAFSRLWFVSFYFTGVTGIIIGRCSLAARLSRQIKAGYITQSVVIYGDGHLAEKVAERLSDNRLGIKVVGLYKDNVNHTDLNQDRGIFHSMMRFVRDYHVDAMILAIPLTSPGFIEAVLKIIRQHPVNVRLLPGELGLEQFSSLKFSKCELPGLHLIPIADRPMADFSGFIKDVVDRIVAAIALMCLLPILGLCAAGIKLSSPGPVLFRQKRVGFKGQDFEIFKFRTMHVSKQPDLSLTRRDDPRVFWFGGILRKLSVDELPQLFNVLKGEMSLVGPRPHMPEARAAGKLYFEAVNEYAGRHRVKPGLTGWAQINGWRGPTETIRQIERRVEHDLYYIENWSLTMDFIIILRTLMIGFYGENAF